MKKGILGVMAQDSGNSMVEKTVLLAWVFDEQGTCIVIIIVIILGVYCFAKSKHTWRHYVGRLIVPTVRGKGETMAFTKSLYYPWIDIRDESWLKTAALYWNHVQTIVPEAIAKPYTSATAISLQDAGILSPFRVQRDLKDIEELVPDVLRYLKSEEGLQLLASADRQYVYLHPEKMPRSLERLSQLHPGKMAYALEDMLRDSGLSRPGRDGFLEVDSKFSEFYMTLLATRISESIGAGLVTSLSLSHNLSLKVKVDAEMPSVLGGINGERRFRQHRDFVPRTLAQGLLVELMMEKITLDPETPIEKIIKYREEYSSELGRFRTKVGELTSSLPDDASLGAMQQYAQDLYLNEVRPSIEDLKKSLSGSRIKWLTNSWMKIAFVFASSSSMLINMGLATANALLVGAGISIVGSGILYNVDKKVAIRSNPYSYLLGLEDGLP